MKAIELRVGNYALYENPHGDRVQITVKAETLAYADKLEPIPLTDEWLVRLCFEKSDSHFVYWIDDVRTFIIDVDNRGYFLCDIDLDVIIKHVHQLQNLFFALTGEELTPAPHKN